MQHPVFHGSLVALPTPFRDGRIDLDAFEGLVDFHADRGTDGIVVAGTTGESTTMSEFERRSLIRAAVEFSRGRLSVVAGVGTNCTRTSVELAVFAAEADVDGLMVVTPYYNRPSRRGLLLHYGAVAEATDLPVLLYNVPSRTGCDLAPDLACELARLHPSIGGIKEASGQPERVTHLRGGSDLAVLCGEDRLLRPMTLAGGVGAVSVTGNVLPNEVAELIAACRPGGDARRAAELEEWIAPVVRDLFVEVNPVPVKSALAWLGHCSDEVRAPLAPLEDASRRRLHRTLTERVVGRQPVGG